MVIVIQCSYIHCHGHSPSYSSQDIVQIRKTNIVKKIVNKTYQMLLNQHNLSFQTIIHSTRVRIIISTDFTALVAL